MNRPRSQVPVTRMKATHDPLLLFLLGLLGLSLGAFFLGLTPYPFGILVLSAFIVARWFYTR